MAKKQSWKGKFAEKWKNSIYCHTADLPNGQTKVLRDKAGEYIDHVPVVENVEHYGLKQECKKCVAKKYDPEDFTNCLSTLGSLVALGDIAMVAFVIIALVRMYA